MRGKATLRIIVPDNPTGVRTLMGLGGLCRDIDSSELDPIDHPSRRASASTTGSPAIGPTALLKCGMNNGLRGL